MPESREEKIFLVDIGNSRVRGAVGSDLLEEHWPIIDRSVESSFDAWFACAEKQSYSDVLVSNVAGPFVAEAFRKFCLECWGVEPTFIVPRKNGVGMFTHYREPAKLGSDRWLAALAAWKKSEKAVCVVDAGTALTIDLVTESGQHLGGLIAPGERLMAASLSNATAQLPQTQTDVPEGFAANTSDAIALGCRAASVGLVNEVSKMLVGYPEFKDVMWYLTGGGCYAISDALRWNTTICPNLVLEGLLEIAPYTNDFLDNSEEKPFR